MFGLTTKIHGFILTRDSAWWLWGKIVGGATLVVTTAADPTFALLDLSWLISPVHMHQLQAVAGLIALLSAKMANSPLPSKADAQKVTLPIQEPNA